MIVSVAGNFMCMFNIMVCTWYFEAFMGWEGRSIISWRNNSTNPDMNNFQIDYKNLTAFLDKNENKFYFTFAQVNG